MRLKSRACVKLAVGSQAALVVAAWVVLVHCGSEQDETTASIDHFGAPDGGSFDGVGQSGDGDGLFPDATEELRSSDHNDAAAPLFGDAACDASAQSFAVLQCFAEEDLSGYEAGNQMNPSGVWTCPSLDELAAFFRPCSVGEGSCCRTPLCGPDVRQLPPRLSGPDAAATEQRCCYLLQEVCGV
jgi:hypothetical protein